MNSSDLYVPRYPGPVQATVSPSSRTLSTCPWLKVGCHPTGLLLNVKGQEGASIHFCSYSTCEKLITWPHLVAKGVRGHSQARQSCTLEFYYYTTE